jgi:hypothetical membrane protein
MQLKLTKLSAISGLIGAILPMALVLLSTYLDKSFSWSRDPLSDIGVGQFGWLFNLAVFLSGLLTLVFATGFLMYLGRSRLAILGVGLFSLGNLGLCLVGVFTEHSGVTHALVALMYFLLTPIGAICLSFVKKPKFIVRIGLPVGAAALLMIVGVPLAVWAGNLPVGFSVAEFLEALVLCSWTSLLSIRQIK